jgi:uncharacterized protein (DUF2147 family)
MSMKTSYFMAALVLVGLLAAMPAAAQCLTPAGIWKDASGRVLVKISSCGDQLCGKLVWFKWPNDDQGLPVIDLKNSDPALRARPLLGLKILESFHCTEDGIWEDGKIYNPDDGVNYLAQMSVEDDGTLHVRLYELFLLFGETHIWTRVR